MTEKIRPAEVSPLSSGTTTGVKTHPHSAYWLQGAKLFIPWFPKEVAGAASSLRKVVADDTDPTGPRQGIFSFSKDGAQIKDRTPGMEAATDDLMLVNLSQPSGL